MEYKYIFGPVPSRRLGVSLGVDLINLKTCNFDCVYCEVGKTPKTITKRGEYVNTETVLTELKDYLKKKPYLDFITFAGSGEPLLNSKIGYLIKEIKKITDTKVAIITNGALFCKDEVIDEILEADIIIPSLDAVTEEVFQKINRPNEEYTIEAIKKGLINLRRKYSGEIALEIFIIDGLNNTKSELDEFKKVIEEIKPDKIQLNSLDRPPVEGWVKKAPIEKLEEIIEYWGLENVEIVTKYKSRRLIKSYDANSEKMILNMIEKRPCTLKDLQEITGINVSELNKYLDVLEKEGKVKSIIGERGVFIKKN